MDVSDILASHVPQPSTVVNQDVPFEINPGFLLVTDTNPIDQDAYNTNLEEHLLSSARNGVQALITNLFSLPTTSSSEGRLVQLPPPSTPLPRAKPLPKQKPPTKWERFAAAKGIQKTIRDRKVWDEETQSWVNRWGRHGKNKKKEEEWIAEVPANADVDFDPAKSARDARKSRVAKNERQHLQNLARANDRESHKAELDKALATARVSTASMGKFDRPLEGEKKMRGLKRKFAPAEQSLEKETEASLALLSKMDSDAKKMKRAPPVTGSEKTLNVRKAIRFASKGQGGVALGRASAGKIKHRKGKK